MEAWFILAIIAMLGYGVQNFMLKVAAERGHNSIRVNTAWMLTVTVASGLFYIFSESSASGLLFLLFAAGNALTYLFANICKIESLKYTPVTIAVPIARMYVAITPLLAFFIFRERITLLQLAGLTLATFAVVMLSEEGRRSGIGKRHLALGLVLASAAAASTSFNNIIGKSAAITGGIMGFIFFSYMLGFLLALLLQVTVNKDRNPIKHLIEDHEAVRLGIITGLINFAAYYFALKALTSGPAMIIFPIIGLGLAITIGLAAWIYGEKMTKQKIIAAATVVAAIILLR